MEYNELTFELNESQYDALESEAKETFFIGGLGSGKTFTLAAAIEKYASVPGSLGFLGSPTKDTMREATFPQVQEALEILGLVQDYHYVVNQLPPQSWGIRAKTKLGSKGVITFAWGAYLIVDGLENFNKRRGTEYDYILVDEFRDVKAGARNVLLGRLRGKCFIEQGIKSRIIYATTPPDNPIYLRKLSELGDPDIEFIFATSHENQENLPEDYIETMERTYDEETIQREIYGKLTSVVHNQFAYAYDPDKHTAKLKFDPSEDIYLAFDFNVNPMTCLAIQTDEETYIRVIKEFRIENSDTYEMCRAINEEFEEYDPHYWVTGDASGGNRQSATRGAMTHYDIIQDELDLADDQINTPTYNASINNSRILLNSILTHFEEFLIDPEECPYLLEDLEFVETETKRNGRIGIKKAGKGQAGLDNATLTHLLDCLRYHLQTYNFDWVKDLSKRQ